MKILITCVLTFIAFINANDLQTCKLNGGKSGVCTPYYLCDNSVIITDGKASIDKRTGSTSRRRRATDNEESECSYTELCCASADKGTEDDNTHIPPKTDKNPFSSIKSCGASNGPNNKLIASNNKEAEFGDFPWMAGVLKQVGKQNIYQCGGSLIHPSVVLTNAECVKESEKNPSVNFKVRLGEYDTQGKTEPLPNQDRMVDKIVIHEKFNTDNAFNDIALLFLEKPVDLTRNVDVVCLPSQSDIITSTNCFASGWGKDVFGKKGRYQLIMKKIDLPVVDHKNCQDALKNTSRLGHAFVLNKSFICAGGIEGKDLCTGDAGAPLVCPIQGKTDKYMQVGIMSWGIGCNKELPGVYTNVAYFRNWIDDQLVRNSIE